MPQWDYPYHPPYSIYQCERPYAQAPQLIKCKLRQSLKSPNHIRLLKVYPPGWPDRLSETLTREEDTQIQCGIYQVELRSVTTKKRPYFATLSYVWGDSGTTHDICCGKETTSVTSSLYEALVYIRNLRTPRLLWVDSLCINQNDDQEKSHQVQRMHLIYGQSHCISWLGAEAKEGADLQSMVPVLRCFSEIAELFATQRFPFTWGAVDEYLRRKPTHGIQNLRQVPWETLRQCLNRRYFGRLWCIQEILVARSNDVRTSRTRIDIAVLTRSASLINGIITSLQSMLPDDAQMLSMTGCSWAGVDSLRMICRGIAVMLNTDPLPCLEFKKLSGPMRHTTAWSVARKHSDKECSNPRDHIYGLAVLCNLGASYQISYSTELLTVADVFINFTLHCLRTTKSLEAFSAMCRIAAVRDGNTPDLAFAYRKWTSGLPSWCADFAGPSPHIRELKTGDSGRELPLRTSKGRSARLTKISKQRLGLIGVQVGVVKACSSVWHSAATAGHKWANQQWARLVSTRKCIVAAEAYVPAKSLWKQYLDVCSTGIDWRQSPPWPFIAVYLPPKTRDRMVKSSIGAAWIMNHLPELALRAGLSLHREISHLQWTRFAGDIFPWLHRINEGTRIFTTDNARAILGTGPEGLCVGDIVCVLFGGDVPFILRPNPEGHYTLIGECYVSGIMRGEALDMGLEEREFVLV